MQKWINRLETWQNGAVEVETIDVRLPGLSASLDGLRLLVVADMHLHGETPQTDRVIARARGARPDRVLIVGDMVDNHTTDLAPLARMLGMLVQIAPCVAILGNNDYVGPDVKMLRRLYAEHGVVLLEDEMRTIEGTAGGLRILGLQDPAAFLLSRQTKREERSQEARSLPALLQETHEKGPVLLLMHRPQWAPKYAQMGIALCVSGHAHGGQVRLPFVGGLFAPGQGMFPQYTSGLYAVAPQLQMVVSRGIGNH
ncbi:MAG: metallophosphoesterase, partial [Clostridia bacterium]